MIPISSPERLLDFLNHIGNLILPGSKNLFVPGWESQQPSDDFFRASQRFEFEINSFQEFLERKYLDKFRSITDEQLQDCILEGSKSTADFFRHLGDLYIIEYYSRTKIQSALGLISEPPFPQGNKVHAGDLDLLEIVFTKGKIHK